MKLRNKKTGEAVYVDFQIPLCNNDEILGSYCVTSLEALNRSFEDYKPKEPLIKDEKIRKAVRAWAEANEVLEVFIDRIGDGTYIELYDEDDGRRRISAPRPAGLKTGEAYTIDELSGEEEE